MLVIAVDRLLGAVYEGAPTFAQEVRPTPVVAPAKIVSERTSTFSGLLPASTVLESAQLVFREDSFDSVSRIRRGRLYTASGVRPETWHVPHPSGQLAPRPVYPFQGLWTPQALVEASSDGARPLLLIGTEATFTIWSITSLEGTAHSEFLMTLRGRQTYGVLPQLDFAVIPSACRTAVAETISKLGQEIFRAGPGSVVDRARDAASAILSGYLQDLGAIGPGEELAMLIDKLNAQVGNQRKRVAAAAAEIVRIFHSREKPSVRERLPVAPVSEQEAELAAMCVASLLIELGWARWP